MQYEKKLSSALGILKLLALTQLSIVALAMPLGVAQSPVPLGPFSSVELHNGGKVVLRHGPTQRVTFVKGSPDCTSVTVAQGGRLVIDSRERHCPGERDLQIEIVTP